jgi:hypothetical protein
MTAYRSNGKLGTLEILGRPSFSGEATLMRASLRSRKRREPIRTRPCPVCNETTTSAALFFCAGCHFAGWWGRWA